MSKNSNFKIMIHFHEFGKAIGNPNIENQWLEFEWEGNWSIENAHKKSLESENHTNSQTLPDFVMGILM